MLLFLTFISDVGRVRTLLYRIFAVWWICCI